MINIRKFDTLGTTNMAGVIHAIISVAAGNALVHNASEGSAAYLAAPVRLLKSAMLISICETALRLCKEIAQSIAIGDTEFVMAQSHGL